ELEGRVVAVEVEPGDVADGRQATREGDQEDQREDDRRDQQRRVLERVLQAAPGDGAGDREIGPHVRSIRVRSDALAPAKPMTLLAPAATMNRHSAVPSQPVMTRLRSPSTRYETGFHDATVRNQSCSIRFRGRFIDDRKKKTNSSGN